MSNSTIRKLVLSLILTFGSLFTLPAFAWPEVDHMNMCGSAVKTARAYKGGFKGWQSHDRHASSKSASGAYYRANCPGTASPAKAAPARKAVRKYRKKRRVRKSKKRYATKCRYVKSCKKVRVKKKRSKKRRVKKRRYAKKYPYIAKKSRRKARSRYNKHADCVRVDRVNSTGSAVRVVSRR